MLIHKIGQHDPYINHNGEAPKNPASTMKLVTSLAALHILGPKKNWTTKVFSTGHIKETTLNGDIFLQGGGDPWLVLERFWILLKKIYDNGIHTINGNIYVDDSFYDKASIGSDIIDGKIYRAYNTLPNALLINFNSTELVINTALKKNTISVKPNIDVINFSNSIDITDKKCTAKNKNISFDVSKNKEITDVILYGEYPNNCGKKIFYRNFVSHNEYIHGVFKSFWQEIGGSFSGNWAYKSTPKDANLLAQLNSIPLHQIIRHINHHSNNVMARMLMLNFGVGDVYSPSSLQKGRRSILQWIETINVPMPMLKIDNGSGLSRTARVSAKGLSDLLLFAATSPWWSEFFNSMPVKYSNHASSARFQGISNFDNMRFKTGLLADVRSLAGYITDSSGNRWAVVILHNHPKAAGRVGITIQNLLLKDLLRKIKKSN